MRYFGNRSIREGTPVFTDSVAIFVLAANTAQAMDYPAGTDMMRIAFTSSAGANQLAGVFNGASTGAAWGSSQTATGGSSTANMLVPPAQNEFWAQRPRGSTGFSVIAPTSGYCHVDFWSRAGTTG